MAPNLEILESFVCGKKNNAATCEDGLVIGAQLVAIIDGVTAKGTRLWEGMSSGCYAKQLLMDCLQQEVPERTAEELFQNLDSILSEAVFRTGQEIPKKDYPRASVIVYNDFYKEIWSYGDCQCRINEVCHSHTSEIGKLNADLRAFYLEHQLMQPGMNVSKLQQNDVGRQAIQKSLMMQFAFENKEVPFGYPVLNGMGIETSMIRCYPVQEGDVITLASDGYPFLEENLQACETKLAGLLKDDPMCFRTYRATKGVRVGNVSFDDRAYCRLRVK